MTELIEPPANSCIAVYHPADNRAVFTVFYDGKVEFGPAFTTEDEASRIFIESLARQIGVQLVQWYARAIPPRETGWYIVCNRGQKSYPAYFTFESESWTGATSNDPINDFEFWSPMPGLS